MGRTSTARARLIDAMARLAHRDGYASVSVDEVCAAANVKKGSFYYFFPSKRDLMLAALDLRDQQARAGIQAATFDPAIPPLDRIRGFFLAVAEGEATNRRTGGQVLGCPFGGVAMTAGAEPTLTRRADQAFSGFVANVRAALRDARAAGDIDRTVDIDEAAEAILAYFQGVALVARTRNDPSLVRRLADRAVLLATGGGAAQRRRPASRPGSARKRPRATRP
jgi:TetR/AcrR family transcriptional regulator, transcriptional repressor for nem operon